MTERRLIRSVQLTRSAVTACAPNHLHLSANRHRPRLLRASLTFLSLGVSVMLRDFTKDLRQKLAANRAQFYLDFASGPFYSFNRPGAQVLQGVIQNWFRQGMAGGAKAHYDGIKAFSETDFTEDLKIIDVPTLVMHGDDDQIVPIADSALLSSKLLKNCTLKVYEKFPHGMCTTHADVVNPDLLAFIKA